MNKSSIKTLVTLAVLAIVPAVSFAQSAKPNWFNLDLAKDGVFGISTEKAYAELLQGKKSKPVIVAVVDGGVDFNHEDLKRVMWINKKEKAGNGKDDDKNGYIDDLHGWNFLGGKNGSVNHETLELTRMVKAGNDRFKDVTEATVAPADKADFEQYQKMREQFENDITTAKSSLMGLQGFANALNGLVKKMGKDNPTKADFEAYQQQNDMEARLKNAMLESLGNDDFKTFYENKINAGLKYYNAKLNYNLNLEYNPRDTVGDDPLNTSDRNYGNADIKGPDAIHGSHVAGIIGADRKNKVGIKGVANNVLIMGVRNTPNGDERDKDVASAIRYAADNGAKVINMSFGKGYSPQKAAVDEAVKYAISKDVLLVHAAGNDNKNLDEEQNFPTNKYLDGSLASSWITVGASGVDDNETLKASFSNYGKTTVDVFAPGVQIYSTTPDNKYMDQQGTSMASPVVAGLAGLIRSYYPKLTALQVKDIILKSVVKINHNIKNREKNGEEKEIPFADLCVTGGIVNAYNALKLAATY